MIKDTENEDIVIPQDIQSEINNKWFYLYRWITSDEIKMSIERDFLKILKYAWPLLAIVSIMISVFFSSIYFFLLIMLLWISIIMSYLFWISLYRSYILVNNSYVVISDSALYVWWKSMDIKDTDKIKSETKYISKVFEEKLFWNSWLLTSKKKFYKDVIEGLFSWFHKINSVWKNRKWSLALVLLYLLYVVILSISYFLGVFFLWIFTLVLFFVNRIALRIVWNKAILIDNLFLRIDKSSLRIVELKDDIYKYLSEAIDNDWKDWLLNKIDDTLTSINWEVDFSIDSSVDLRKKIENSKYKDIMNFSIYNSWLKKQIKEPLIQIKELLILSIESLNKSKVDILLRIENVKRKSLISNLELQLERIDMQTLNIKDKIKDLDIYIQKL